MSEKWDKRFLDLAAHISTWSKDPSTKVGCVVVGEDREIRSTGFNGFPRGIKDDEERLSDREKKYPLICHAEEKPINHAPTTRLTHTPKTPTHTTPPPPTAPPSARGTTTLLPARDSEVVYPADIEIPERWQDDFATASAMMKEAEVNVRQA